MSGAIIRVLIADDHPLLRRGIRMLLEKEADISVIGEAQDGREAVTKARRLSPDVVIMDVNMPRLGGIQAMKMITELRLPVQVIFLSMYSDESMVKKAIRNGARGYILKDSVPEQLLTAIRKVYTREMFISPAISSTIIDELLSAQISTGELDPFELLTPREREICKLIADGFTNHAIALDLGISIKTVEKHRANLMDKLGVRDLAGLMRAAIKHGIVFIDG